MEVRRSSGRRQAKAIAQGKQHLEKQFTAPPKRAITNRLNAWARGDGAPQSKQEKKLAASAAGRASHGKGNPAWEAAFKHLWYHDKDHWNEETGQYEM